MTPTKKPFWLGLWESSHHPKIGLSITHVGVPLSGLAHSPPRPAVRRKNGYTALRVAVHNCRPVNLAILNVLIRARADLNTKDHSHDGFYGGCALPPIRVSAVVADSPRRTGRWTALHKAAHDGFTDVCQLLISSGADQNIQNAGGYVRPRCVDVPPTAKRGPHTRADLCRMTPRQTAQAVGKLAEYDAAAQVQTGRCVHRTRA